MSRPRWRARSLVVAATSILISALVVSTPATAFWSPVSVGPGSGAATTATVGTGATPTVSIPRSNSADVTVRWAATNTSTGVADTGYTVARYGSDTVARTILSACTGTITALTCTESGVPDGVWTYAITPRYQNWVGVEGARSASIRVDTTAPVNRFSLVNASGGASVTGTTVYYRGTAAGSFNLSNALTDVGGSGPGGSNTGALPANQTQWQHNADSVSTPTGGPYVSSVFTWSAAAAGSSLSFAVGVAGGDIAGNTAASTLTFTPDDTAPTGGAISYTNGTVYAKSLAVALASTSDTGSGVNAAASLLQRSTAPLSSDGTTCGTFGAFATVVTGPAASQSVSLSAGSCYQFQYVVADNVGNTLTTTSASVVKVPTYAGTVAATPALLSYYRLGETGAATSIADAGPAGNTGTYSGSPTQGVTGALAGDGNTAVAFDGVDDYGKVTRQIADDFSIEFWLKTTQAPTATGTSWFSGVGLVDADVSTVLNDFGVGLLSTGQIGAGTGNPDTSAVSSAAYNDGSWHHIVMTRTKATGAIVLYADGTQVATATGGTQSLTSPAEIDFGRLANDNARYYKGSLDEIALYSGALTAAQVRAHYQVGTP